MDLWISLPSRLTEKTQQNGERDFTPETLTKLPVCISGSAGFYLLLAALRVLLSILGFPQ